MRDESRDRGRRQDPRDRIGHRAGGAIHEPSRGRAYQRVGEPDREEQHADRAGREASPVGEQRQEGEEHALAEHAGDGDSPPRPDPGIEDRIGERRLAWWARETSRAKRGGKTDDERDRDADGAGDEGSSVAPGVRGKATK